MEEISKCVDFKIVGEPAGNPASLTRTLLKVSDLNFTGYFSSFKIILFTDFF